VRSLDPVVTSPSVIALAARGPNPKGGQRLIDFILSAEGQKIIANQGRVPARFESVTSLKVYYVKPELARDFDRREKEFREIFLRAR
jgi:ABC-type Fe3+ transport system substrate-binding protein